MRKSQPGHCYCSSRVIIWDILTRYGRPGIRVMRESEEVPMHIVLQEVNSMDFPSMYLAGPVELRLSKR